ncbi:MAG: hypothetical protein EA398_16410 [Deltaproteobacteria bacterium]|nr:MAG: hypothetical protein EA398_16410 [Deltaproteobacteria bacterium]
MGEEKMDYRLIHVGRASVDGEDRDPRVQEKRYADVEAIVRFLREPWHPYSGAYDRWEDGELRTGWFCWDVIGDREVQHAVRGAEARSHAALVEACRRLSLPLPEGAP